MKQSAIVVPKLFWLALCWIGTQLCLLQLIPSSCARWLALGCATMGSFALVVKIKGNTARQLRLLLLFASLGGLSASRGLEPLHPTKWPDWQTQFATRLHQRLQQQAFDSTECGLLVALICGDKQWLEKQTKRQFQHSGVAHLLALSGLHIGLLFQLLKRLFFFLPGQGGTLAHWRGAASLILLWFYAGCTGLSPSILRAVIMCTLYEIGHWKETPSNGLQALSVSAILIALGNPLAPSQLSFQLSFLAMLGIFFIHPILSKITRQTSDGATQNTLQRRLKQGSRMIWSSISITLSCQIATLPLVLARFHSFPLSFQLANLLTAPLTAWIIQILPVCLLGYRLWPEAELFHDLIGIPLSWLLKIVSIIPRFS